jgi:formate-dependent nitrite reductase cytochrome c552 subunit
MSVEFYDVKTRQKVKIEDKNVLKTTFTTKNGQTRYGLRGKTDDGRMLTKFVSKGDWDAGKYSEEKKAAAPKKK